MALIKEKLSCRAIWPPKYPTPGEKIKQINLYKQLFKKNHQHNYKIYQKHIKTNWKQFLQLKPQLPSPLPRLMSGLIV